MCFLHCKFERQWIVKANAKVCLADSYHILISISVHATGEYSVGLKDIQIGIVLISKQTHKMDITKSYVFHLTILLEYSTIKIPQG